MFANDLFTSIQFAVVVIASFLLGVWISSTVLRNQIKKNAAITKEFSLAEDITLQITHLATEIFIAKTEVSEVIAFCDSLLIDVVPHLVENTSEENKKLVTKRFEEYLAKRAGYKYD